MSIKVMSRVWDYSQAKGSNLLVLLAIADYAHEDGGGAYPSIATLAAKTRMAPRGIYRIIKELEGSGELAVQRQTGRGRTNIYYIRVQSLQGDTSDNLERVHEDSQRLHQDAIKGEPPCTERVKPHERQTVIEPLDEPSIEPLDIQAPDWFQTLKSINGFRYTLEHCRAWLLQRGFGEELANTTAYSVKSKWPGQKSRPYTDPWATFQSWILRPPLQANNQSASPATPPLPIPADSKHGPDAFAQQEARRAADNLPEAEPGLGGPQ